MAKKTTDTKITDAVFEDVPETKVEATETTAEETADAAVSAAESLDAVVESNVSSKAVEIKPLDWQKALAKLPEDEKEQVVALSNEIDVRKIENVMSYGSAPLRSTFEQCGVYLKKERGSSADQTVIKQVQELSEIAQKNHEDFKLALKEPNFLQKILLKLSSNAKKSHSEKIQKSAVSNFNLVGELKASSDGWNDMLVEGMKDIMESALSDKTNVSLLEKYIMAGDMAEERIKGLIEAKKAEYDETGSVDAWQEYEELQEGYEIFQITMANLKKTRGAYYVSLAELGLNRRSNRNVQVAIRTQIDHTLTVFVQQLRNAVHNEKTKEVAEGQKSLIRLNDEVIQAVAQNIGTTAKESEALLYQGIYHYEAAEKAITSILDTCKIVNETKEKLLPELQAHAAKVDQLVEELGPAVASIANKKVAANNTAKVGTSTTTNANASGKLEF